MINKQWILGIDIGGSGVRCLLVNTASGDTFNSACSGWEFPEAPGTIAGFDIDLDRIWRHIGETSQTVLAKAGINGDSVMSVAVSAIRFGTVIVDKGGSSLFAVPTRDARAAGEFLELAEAEGDDILQDTGCWPLPIYASARLMWVLREKPEILKSATAVFSIGDWANAKLTDVNVTDYTQAASSGLFDIHKRQWSWDRIARLGLSKDIFPEVRCSGTAIGNMTRTAAAHMGLHPDVVVGLGGGDSQCSLLGGGIITPGETAFISGTTGPIQTLCDKPAIDLEGRCFSGLHVVPDQWVLESSSGPMGETLTFMSQLLFPEAPDPELRLLAEAQTAEVGSCGMLSTVGAEVMNAKSPVLSSGQLTLSHTLMAKDANPRSQMCRSLIEGYACAVRANIEQLESVTGPISKEIHLTGGFSRSGVFAQILSDLCGRNVIRSDTHLTSALGAVICASVAAGQHTDFKSAVNALVKPTSPVAPIAEHADANAALYSSWNGLREASKSTVTPAIFNHTLSWMFKDLATDDAIKRRPIEVDKPLRALVSAAFDQDSLDKMSTLVNVTYENFRAVNRVLSGQGLVDVLQQARINILVTEVDVVDAKSLSLLPELRVIAACRGSAVNVDVDACTAFGIPVLYAPGRNALAVADLTVAFILASARKLMGASVFLKDESVTAGNMGKMGQAFKQFQGQELWGKTIGLIGIGAVGREVASRLSGFGARILAADPYASNEQAALAGVALVDLDTLLGKSDFISLHAAVTPETTGMLGAAQFCKMKMGAVLINTARAALVDEPALITALESGHLGGAALDTFNQEPPGFDHPLITHPNVISTPHCAGNTFEVAHHQGEAIADALAKMLRGETPDNVLNPQVLAHFDWNAERTTLDDNTLEALINRPGPAITDLDKPAEGKDAAAVADMSLNEVTASPDVIAKMSVTLARFCAAMSEDEYVRALSIGLDVSLGFQVGDLGLEFYIVLNDGVVTAALGKVDGGADVRLGMRAEYIDGMLSGSKDAMEAVMDGYISFAGDAGKGLTIARLEADMKRIYNAIVDELGSPGDLAGIPLPGGAIIRAPAIVGVADIRQQLLDTVNELYAEGVITATGGNVSVRNPDVEGQIWITPSQVFKGDLTPELMVLIDLDGKPLIPGQKAPSSEKSFHTQILKKKPEANVVIHAHAPFATILANAGIPFLPISSEAAFFGGDIARVPYMTPGSDELAEAVSDIMVDEWAVFMVNHGVVCAGRSLRKACDMIQIIDRTAEVILGCFAVGKEPPLLPQSAIDKFRAIGDIIA